MPHSKAINASNSILAGVPPRPRWGSQRSPRPHSWNLGVLTSKGRRSEKGSKDGE